MAEPAYQFILYQVYYCLCKLLILLVGERGFEPPTPWSRIGCRSWLQSLMAWALLQMHEGEEVGLSSASSEFQEKMRLGGIYRLGFTHLSF
jgi:hypothetical protein